MGRKKHKKNISLLTYGIVGLILIWLALGAFLFLTQSKVHIIPGIYLSSEKVSQGDTVVIKVTTNADRVTGKFNNNNLLFYKKPNSKDWISLLGIDVAEKPGVYEIAVDTSNSEHFTRTIVVSLAEFASKKPVASPSLKQTGITKAGAVNNIVNKDNPAIDAIFNNPTPFSYFTSPFSFPLSEMKVSGYQFGQLIGFGSSELRHLCTDFKAADNTNLYAINDGRVVATLHLSNYGETLIIDHGLNIFSMYVHLNEFKVTAGQMVKKGQVVGLSGSTGYGTGPHLCFSVRLNGARVDPLGFIKATDAINQGDVTVYTASVWDSLANIFNTNH